MAFNSSLTMSTPGLSNGGRSAYQSLKKLWKFYSGKSGIGRFVQTSFLFYGGLTTLLLTYFSIRFNVFDGTMVAAWSGTWHFIGFGELPVG